MASTDTYKDYLLIKITEMFKENLRLFLQRTAGLQVRWVVCSRLCKAGTFDIRAAIQFGRRTENN